jgi:hypothetical protein
MFVPTRPIARYGEDILAGEMVVGWAAFVHTLSAEMMSRLDLALHAWQLVGGPLFSYPSGSIWVLCCSDAAAPMEHVVS